MDPAGAAPSCRAASSGAPTGAPRLSEQWARLREDTTLQGRAWSLAATRAADAWLAALFASALGTGAGAGSEPPAADKIAASAGAGGSGGGRGLLGGWRARKDAGREPASATGGRRGTGVALLAVGSLGRGDVAPGSDLDLLLVHSGQEELGPLADRLWYPIWDDPMPLDHSVRTPAQVGQAAESDLRVALGLLDVRLVAGDAELAAEVVRTGHRLWEKRAARWLPELLRAREDARLPHGDVAFLLEPELQEGRGGLRDLQALAVMAKVTPVVSAVVADPRLGDAGNLLHSVRVELQRPTGKRSERLLLEDQDRVGEALGYGGREELARALAAAARTVGWLMDDASRRVLSWVAGPRGRGGSADRALGPGLVLRDGEVAVPVHYEVASDPTLALRAATASAESGAPLARPTMERLTMEAPEPAQPWAPEVLRAFLRLLSTGQAGVAAVETLDQLGVWERYIPEWAAVRNRPQFNPYHRWTVDRHLLEAVAGAAGSALEVRRPDLLLLGALLHDIGKGAGPDHSEAGVRIARPLLRRMGLADEDRRILEQVVLYHLLLPDVATRRDLDDPATAALVADAVGDLTTLELLGALAGADGGATGPAAWTAWKARLVSALVQRAGAVLEGRPVPTGPPFPSVEQRQLLELGRTQVLPGHDDLVVVTADRPGLFSDLTGVLALHGIGVLEARAHSESGQVIDRFVLDLPEGAEPRWERITADVVAAAERRLNVTEALARRATAVRARRATTLAAPAVHVSIDNDASTSATVVEVRAGDAPGLLHRVSAALAGTGLDIVSARASTLGNAAIDTFYVKAEGDKLAGPAEIEQVRLALQAALEATGTTHKS